MTIKTAVEFDGDASGIVDAGREASRAIDGVGDSARSMVGDIVKGGLALVGFGAAVEGAKRAVESVVSTVSDYIERNVELTSIVDANRAATQGYTDDLLALVVTEENVATVTGTLAEVMGEVAAAFAGADDEGAALGQTMGVVIVDGARLAVGALRAGNNVLTAVRLTMIGTQIYTHQLASAMVDLGGVIVQVVLDALGGLVSMLSDLAARAAPLAGSVAPALGEALAEVAAMGDRASDSVGAMAENVRMAREEMSAASARGMAEYRDEVDNVIAASTRLDERLDTLGDGLVGVRERVLDGAVAQDALARSTNATAAATSTLTSDLTEQLAAGKAAAVAASRAAAKAREFEAARMAAALAADNEAAKREAEEASRAAVKLARIEAERAAEVAAFDARAAAYERWAGVSVDALAQVASGEASLATASRAAIGDTVNALADAALARAAIAFASGNVGGAVALGGAAAFARTIASALGGGSAGGGVASAAAGPVTTITNQRSIVINGLVTSDMVPAIAGMVGEAERRGLL
jgi:hypothetical protein